MAYNRDWLEVNPIDHTKFSAQPGNVRAHKVDISDRLKAMFKGFVSGETQTDEGVINLPFNVQGSDPGASASKIKLYSKDVSGKAELFAQDEDGNVIQITLAGVLNLAAVAVLLTTDQTVAGIKTFSSIPVLPASNPTADNEAARKKFVDDSVSSGDQRIRGWVNFNGSSGAVIRDSFNVSSVSRSSTGVYIVNWDTNFANANYCVVLGIGESSNSGRVINVSGQLSGSVTINVVDTVAVFIDVDFINVMAIGDQ